MGRWVAINIGGSRGGSLPRSSESFVTLLSRCLTQRTRRSGSPAPWTFLRVPSRFRGKAAFVSTRCLTPTLASVATTTTTVYRLDLGYVSVSGPDAADFLE